MNSKLTYLFFLSFAAFLASACASDAPDDVEVSKGSELTFDVAGLSRGSVTTSFSEFAVFGDMKKPSGTGNTISNPTVLFDKVIVTYDGQKWSYQGTQYWYPSHEHSFVAISPSALLESGNYVYANSQHTFTYTIPTTTGILSDRNNVTDIIVATHRKLYNLVGNATTTPEKGVITLKFGHILSLINIAPAFIDSKLGKEDCIKIHELKLSGFKTKATFSILPAERQSNTQTDDRVIEVTGHDTDAELTIKFPDPKTIKNDGNHVSLFDSDDAIIMLPQAFDANSDAKIILSFTVNNETSEKQAILPLKDILWESGKNYSYKITINRLGLILDKCDISAWNDVTMDVIEVD